MVDLQVVKSHSDEKRAYRRLPWTFEKGKNILISPFSISDISPDGIGVISKLEFRKNSCIDLQLPFQDRLLKDPLKCEVVWKKRLENHDYFAGTKLVSQSPEVLSLTKYLYTAVRDQFLTRPDFSPVPIHLRLGAQKDHLLVGKIKKINLPCFFREILEKNKEFSQRPDYLWKYCYMAMKETTLSCVDTAYEYLLSNTKLIGFIWSVELDDLADQSERSLLLEECLKAFSLKRKISLKSIPKSQREKAVFLDSIWDLLQKNLQQLPRYKEFKDIIHYDFDQTLNTLAYSKLSNRYPHIINDEEVNLYEGNNINVMIDAMLDIMGSPGFDASELGRLRECVWHGQMMCKIANWIATWRREVRVGDWSSGIVSAALKNDVIGQEDLLKRDYEFIERRISQSPIEEELMWKWQKHRSLILGRVMTVKSVDLFSYLKSMEKFYCMQIASTGLQ